MPRPDHPQKDGLTRPAAAVAVQLLSRQGEGNPYPVFCRVAPGLEDDALRRGGDAGAGLIALKIRCEQRILPLDQLAVIPTGHGQEPGELRPIPARSRPAFHIHDGGNFHLHPAATDVIAGDTNARHAAIHHHRGQIGRRAGAKAGDIRPIGQDGHPGAGGEHLLLRG